MASDDSIETFQAITGADQQTAEHVLEAHGWDLNKSVNFFMESAALPSTRASVDQPQLAHPAGGSTEIVDIADSEPDDDFQLGRLAAGHSPATEDHRPPSPLAGDYDIRAALAASLSAGENGGREAAEQFQHREEPTDVPSNGGGLPAMPLLPNPATTIFPGLPPEFLEGPSGPRIRRNRPRGASAADTDMDHLAAMGVASSLRQPFGSPPALRSHSMLGGESRAANGHAELDMPAGIDMEEARMLEAAMLGIPYEGRMPAFGDSEQAEPVSPSVLRHRELREEQDNAYQESLLADQQKADAVEAAKRSLQEERLRSLQAEEDAAQAQQSYEREISEKLSGLPAEPAAEDPEGVSVMIRLPNGSRFSRRFSRADQCKDLFNFTDVNAAPSYKPESYRLVTQYPRRVFLADTEGSMADAGLVQKQEALFLEPL